MHTAIVKKTMNEPMAAWITVKHRIAANLMAKATAAANKKQQERWKGPSH
jgi:hypothetical protein